MRTTALSALVLLGATLVASTPIRVVVTTHQEVSSNSFHGPFFEPAVAHIATGPIPVEVIRGGPVHGGHPPGTQDAPARRPCGAMRAKALDATNRFRAMFGFPPIQDFAPSHTIQVLPYPNDLKRPVHDVLPAHQAQNVHEGAAPVLPFVGTPVRPAFAVEGEDAWNSGRPVHRIHRFQHHRLRGSFLRRVHHALMALGPWEGRAVAFVLGCGIGVLLRMMWVIVLVTARAIRGNTSSEDDTDADGYAVVFDDEEAELLVPPPQYTVVAGGEAVPVSVSDEKSPEKV